MVVCLPSLAATNYVRIKDSAFLPEQLVVYPGDTVTWIQEDTTEHSVTSSEQVFNSGTLVPGTVYSFTFDEVGTHSYFCSFHGAGAMAGLISVAKPGPNAPPGQPLNVLPPPGATNQPVAVRLHAGPFSDPDTNDFHAASQWLVRYKDNGAIAADSGPVGGAGLTEFRPPGLIEDTTYDWQVRYRDGRGGWSDYSKATRFTTLVAFKEPGIGLRGSYFNTADFSAPTVVVTNKVIDFDWGRSRPHRRITTEGFAVRWEGSVLPRFSESYQFELEFRGRARLWVDGVLLIDDWTASPFILARRASAALVAGRLVPVRIEYAADSHGALAILRWMSPNVPTEVIPALRMFPPKP